MKPHYRSVTYTAVDLKDIADWLVVQADSLATADKAEAKGIRWAAEVVRTTKFAGQKSKRAAALRTTKVKGWTTKTGKKVKGYTRTLKPLSQDKPVRVKAHTKKRLGKKVPIRKHTRAARGDGTNSHPREAQS